MKRADVKPNTYIDSSKEMNYQGPKFKIDDIVRISKWKNIFAKGYVPNLSEEVSRLRKLKTLFRGHILLVILKGKKLLEGFKRKLPKTNQKVPKKRWKSSKEKSW